MERFTGIWVPLVTPFGEDVIPHEKTYKGPIEDRMKLMRATGMRVAIICRTSPS